MSTQPVTLDMSTAQPLDAGGVKLDMSTAQPLSGQPAIADQSHAEISAHPGGVKQWLTDLESDLRYGGSQTVVGRALKSAGYQGAETFGDQNHYNAPGKTLVSPLTGPTFAAHGIATAASGHPVKGAGEVLSGVGEAAEIPMQFAAPEAKEFSETTEIPGATAQARRMYQSALKPSTRLAPARVEQAITTGLDNKIPVSKAGQEKLGALIDDVNDAIATTVANGRGKTVNPYAVTSRLSDTAEQFKTQVNPDADLSAISDSGNEFLKNNPNPIPANDAQAMKQGTYQQLKGRSFGELKTASIEAQKALARGLKEELNTQFPELAKLNKRDSDFYGLDSMLDKAVAREGNHQIIGLGGPIAGTAAKAVTSSNKVGVIAGVIKTVADNPAIKSRLAMMLNHAGVPLPIANGRVAAYFGNLGNIVSQGTDSSGPRQ